MNLKKALLILISTILLSSCGVQIKLKLLKDEESTKSAVQIILENMKSTTYKGWWIYGEGLHIFKDEQTLDEYYLEFVGEDIKELQALYLAMCEMEYYPMECAMTGYIKKNLLENENILVVTDFEILYVQGCEE
jgi:hypothetical protein